MPETMTHTEACAFCGVSVCQGVSFSMPERAYIITYIVIYNPWK